MAKESRGKKETGGRIKRGSGERVNGWWEGGKADHKREGKENPSESPQKKKRVGDRTKGGAH